MSKQEVMSNIEKAVVGGKKEDAVKFAKEALAMGVPALETIDGALIKGMNVIGDKYAAHQVFLPQVLLAANAMYGALDELLPHIPKAASDKMVHMVIGVVEGDVHDIGKNIVKTMFTAGGFTVTDLGKDVPVETFVNSTQQTHSQVVALSTLMTPTMEGMKNIVDGLVESGYRMKCKIIIGGAPTSQEFAEEIGADFHAVNAQAGVAKIKGAL